MNLINLAEQVGLQPKFKALSDGGEYCSPCPKCGGNDRFYMQPNKQQKNCLGFYRCRKCEIKGDAIQFARNFLGLDFKEAVSTVGGNLPERTSLFHLKNIEKKKGRFNPASIKEQKQKWHKEAAVFVQKSYENVWRQPNIYKWLNARGISEQAIEAYKIGYNPISQKMDWGLKKGIYLPAGIVIPTIELCGKISHLKIRRTNWTKYDNMPKYIAVSGSRNGLNIIGSTKKEFMIVVESELDAYAIHCALQDIALVVAVGSNIKNPDNLVDYLAKQKNILLIYDNDDGGKAMYHKWKQLYPHMQAYTVPFGKDIGEAIEQGLDVRHWLLTTIIKDQKWKPEEKQLICWFLNHVKDRGAMRDSYKVFEQEIVLGPGSARAQSNELQKELLIIRQLIEGLY